MKEEKVVSFRPDDSVIPLSQVKQPALSLSERCMESEYFLKIKSRNLYLSMYTF